MTDLQLELTKLIGSKELSLGCILESKEYNTWNTFLYDTFENKIVTLGHQFPTVETWEKGALEIIGNPATLEDLHRWLIENDIRFIQDQSNISFLLPDKIRPPYSIQYDASLTLLYQPSGTIEYIIDFIKYFT